MTSAGIELTVYIRAGCHLCDAMLLELEEFRKKQAFSLKVIDIAENSELESRFSSRIPVLCTGDTEISHFFFDPKALQEYFG